MARFSTKGIQAGGERVSEYLGDINESNQWNTLMSNLQKTAQYKAKRDQAQQVQAFLRNRASTTQDPYLQDIYDLSALDINPILGEDVNASTYAAYPFGLKKQELYADAAMQRAQLSQGGQNYRMRQNDLDQFETAASKLVADEDSNELTYKAVAPNTYAAWKSAQDELKYAQAGTKSGSKERKEAFDKVTKLKQALNQAALSRAGSTSPNQLAKATLLGIQPSQYTYGSPASVGLDVIRNPSSMSAPEGFGVSQGSMPYDKTLDSELLQGVIDQRTQQRFGY